MFNKLLAAVLALSASGCQYVQFDNSLSEAGTIIRGQEFAGDWKELPSDDDPFGPTDHPVDLKITLNDDQSCTVSSPLEQDHEQLLVTGRLVRIKGKIFFELVSVEESRHGKTIVSTGPEEIQYFNLISVARQGDELLVSLPKVEEFREAVFEANELEGRRIDYLSNQIAVTSEPAKLGEYLTNNHDRIFSTPRRYHLVSRPGVPDREQLSNP